VRPLRRALSATLAIAAIMAVAPTAPHAQETAQPAADLGVDDKGRILLEDRFQVKVEWRLSLGVFTAPQPPAGSGQSFYFFSDDDLDVVVRIITQSPCFPERPFVYCPLPPVTGYVIKLGPLDDKLKISAEVPKLPGKSSVDAGAGDDAIKGGKNGEAIDPGKGEDKVDAGKGDDKIDSRDGDPDVIDGGPGKRDVATVDSEDKVKNVEVVKRK
jgi:hypothetical protein